MWLPIVSKSLCNTLEPQVSLFEHRMVLIDEPPWSSYQWLRWTFSHFCNQSSWTHLWCTWGKIMSLDNRHLPCPGWWPCSIFSAPLLKPESSYWVGRNREGTKPSIVLSILHQVDSCFVFDLDYMRNIGLGILLPLLRFLSRLSVLLKLWTFS